MYVYIYLYTHTHTHTQAPTLTQAFETACWTYPCTNSTLPSSASPWKSGRRIKFPCGLDRLRLFFLSKKRRLFFQEGARGRSFLWLGKVGKFTFSLFFSFKNELRKLASVCDMDRLREGDWRSWRCLMGRRMGRGFLLSHLTPLLSRVSSRWTELILWYSLKGLLGARSTMIQLKGLLARPFSTMILTKGLVSRLTPQLSRVSSRYLISSTELILWY